MINRGNYNEFDSEEASKKPFYEKKIFEYSN